MQGYPQIGEEVFINVRSAMSFGLTIAKHMVCQVTSCDVLQIALTLQVISKIELY
jgi:hypothetical protein